MSNTLERIAGFLEGRPAVLAVVLAVLYLAAAWRSMTRRMWLDELFTYYISTAPTLNEMWWQIRHLDFTPPLIFLLTRASITLFGDSEFATRVPSLITYFIGSGCIGWYLSRRLGRLYGLAAVLAFWCTPAFYYAMEARPYGLLLGSFGVALVARDYARDVTTRRLALPVLGLGAILLQLSHVYGAFWLVPLWLAEGAWSWRARRVDKAVWACLLAPLLVLALWMPLIARATKEHYPAVFRAGPLRVPEFFYRMVWPATSPLFVATLVALLMAWALPARPADRRKSLTLEDAALFTGAILLPAGINLVVMVLTRGSFFERYGLLAVFAFVAFWVTLIAAYTSSFKIPALITCVTLGLTLIAQQIAIPAVLKARRAHIQASTVHDIRPDLPFVTASGITFIEMDHYEDPGFLSRVYYLTDREAAIRYSNATIFEVYHEVKKHFPIRANVAYYKDFVARHKRYVVLADPYYPEDWLLHKLKADGAKVDLIKVVNVPYKDTQVFEVTMPDSGASAGSQL